MVYTPTAFGLINTMRAETGFADTRQSLSRQVQHPAHTMKTYEVSSLLSDGKVRSQRLVAPSSMMFQAAFSAFAHGTLITTTRGPVAVEDLTPGMKIVTNERGPSPLLWIGSMTMNPNTTDFDPDTPRLTRIMADALGVGRPMPGFMAGPGARILKHGAGIQDKTLMPVREFVDGMNVIHVNPPSPVKLYHLALHRHATITAAGLDVETFHPGPGFENVLPHQDLTHFLSLFPHIRRPSDFGSLAYPRQPLRKPSGQRDVA